MDFLPDSDFFYIIVIRNGILVLGKFGSGLKNPAAHCVIQFNWPSRLSKMKYFDPDCIEFNINIAPGAPGSGEKRKKIHPISLHYKTYCTVGYFTLFFAWTHLEKSKENNYIDWKIPHCTLLLLLLAHLLIWVFVLICFLHFLIDLVLF